ncbi:glutaredoxin family protein [Amycolatopsis tucumanensis]|uniref:Glutaredoxin n=1 Tax=Amycolatopsis tucumanensis TaxID=401106 RepID=A0ABP7JHR2_9PSEU|nr:glutaredoxin family protein [Amycolatopsis tucumanensis]MCF6425235.1 conjugal transfer protein TraF [Amycolatopsis tucumanensis]
MTEPVQITLLTQHDCGFCDQAKQVLNRLADEYPLQVSEIDLASPEGQRLATQAGVLFAPGVLVDAQPFSFGRLSERKLRRKLNTRVHT